MAQKIYRTPALDGEPACKGCAYHSGASDSVKPECMAANCVDYDPVTGESKQFIYLTVEFDARYGAENA